MQIRVLECPWKRNDLRVVGKSADQIILVGRATGRTLTTRLAFSIIINRPWVISLCNPPPIYCSQLPYSQLKQSCHSCEYNSRPPPKKNEEKGDVLHNPPLPLPQVPAASPSWFPCPCPCPYPCPRHPTRASPSVKRSCHHPVEVHRPIRGLQRANDRRSRVSSAFGCLLSS